MAGDCATKGGPPPSPVTLPGAPAATAFAGGLVEFSSSAVAWVHVQAHVQAPAGSMTPCMSPPLSPRLWPIPMWFLCSPSACSNMAGGCTCAGGWPPPLACVPPPDLYTYTTPAGRDTCNASRPTCSPCVARCMHQVLHCMLSVAAGQDSALAVTSPPCVATHQG